MTFFLENKSSLPLEGGFILLSCCTDRLLWLCLFLDRGDTELTTDTLTGQSGRNLLFVDVLWQIMRDEQEHVCECIYETLHSSFSSNVATWVVVCISRASPGSLPASWQHCGPIYGLRQQINQQRHSDKSSATSTDLKERVKATLEESIFRKEDTACLMQRAPLEVCVIHISKWRPTTSLWINIRKRVRSWQQFNSFQDMQLFSS